jgi:hypothetical protein
MDVTVQVLTYRTVGGPTPGNRAIEKIKSTVLQENHVHRWNVPAETTFPDFGLYFYVLYGRYFGSF